MKTKNLLNTEKQKIKVAEKLIEVFANHAVGDLSLYLNGERWEADTEYIIIDPELCKNCQNYLDNLQDSYCWENLDTWGMSNEETLKAKEKVAYCHKNHEGTANKDNPNYHGTRCKRKKCQYKSKTKWSYKATKLEDYTSRVEGAYGNPDTITVVYEGSSACSTLEYNEFGGRDAFVSAIDNVIPDGYYFEYGTSWSLYLASLD